jgi:hypothetical protein
LWDIDLLINRTLVYVPLTAILAGLYSASISLFQKVFIATTGAKSDAALVISTFLLATTFTPIKGSLQSVVDRRFKESANPLKEIDGFRNQVQAVMDVLDTRLITCRLLNTAISALHASGGAIYLDRSAQRELVQATPGWQDEQSVIGLPLEWEGKRVGLLFLGRREAGVDYSAQERQALQQAASQVAQVLAGRYKG